MNELGRVRVFGMEKDWNPPAKLALYELVYGPLMRFVGAGEVGVNEPSFPDTSAKKLPLLNG